MKVFIFIISYWKEQVFLTFLFVNFAFDTWLFEGILQFAIKREIFALRFHYSEWATWLCWSKHKNCLWDVLFYCSHYHERVFSLWTSYFGYFTNKLLISKLIIIVTFVYKIRRWLKELRNSGLWYFPVSYQIVGNKVNKQRKKPYVYAPMYM